jgi:5-methyltetrahydrofolate--homocysteine methyltransferase
MSVSRDQLKEALIKGKSKDLLGFLRDALKEGMDPVVIMNEVFIPAMIEVGDLFSSGKYFLPQMMIAARAMGDAMKELEPALSKTSYSKKAVAVIGTVQDDFHDIGKNIVRMILSGAGYEMIDLGIDVHSDKFIDAIKEHKPRFVLLSALITLTMQNMANIIKDIEKSGLRSGVIIGVGGAPVTTEFAKEIGADFYAEDAHEAVLKCDSYVS